MNPNIDVPSKQARVGVGYRRIFVLDLPAGSEKYADVRSGTLSLIVIEVNYEKERTNLRGRWPNIRLICSENVWAIPWLVTNP
jgi:hypothetical protein